MLIHMALKNYKDMVYALTKTHNRNTSVIRLFKEESDAISEMLYLQKEYADDGYDYEVEPMNVY